MVELIRWIYDFLTSTTDKKLDVIIRGIEILKTYAEKNITNEEQRIKWETEVESWIEQIWDARVNDDNKMLSWLGDAGRAVYGPEYEYRRSPDQFMLEKRKKEEKLNVKNVLDRGELIQGIVILPSQKTLMGLRVLSLVLIGMADILQGSTYLLNSRTYPSEWRAIQALSSTRS